MWWKEFEIVDAHAHIGDFGSEFGLSMDLNSLKSLMREYNYDKCIISNRDNALVEAAVNASEDILGLVWANPRKPKCAETLLNYLKKDGFIGIKLHPLFDAYLPDSVIVHPIAKIAEDLSLPILIHCGHPPFSLPWSIEGLAKEFPDVKIVLGHMGHGHIVYINASISVALRNENVYLETSGMPMHTKVREAVERVGKDRVMYGDDLPFGHPSWELEKVRASGLEKDDLRRVLGSNARKLYGL